MKAGVIWKETTIFEGFNDKNSEKNFVKSDGPTPKHLFLQSIAGCTAIDVVGILEKMHSEMPTEFVVSVEGDLTENHPRVFKNFIMVYDVRGNVDPAKLKRAVKLSQENYCGISTMAKKIAPFEIKVVLNGNEI